MIDSSTFRLLFACGADPEPKDPPRVELPKPGPPRKKAANKDDDDDDDDDEDLIPDPRDRKIKRLSRENGRRRNHERDLEEQLESANEHIAELTSQVENGIKLQKRYDTLKTEHEGLLGSTKEQAIRTAISGDMTEDGKPRAWYDTSMVLSLLDREGLAVDLSDGSVGGLKEQLEAIAKEKPFLLKNASGDQGNSANNQPSGFAPQSSAGGNRRQVAADSERELVDMFPALRNVTK